MDKVASRNDARRMIRSSLPGTLLLFAALPATAAQLPSAQVGSSADVSRPSIIYQRELVVGDTSGASPTWYSVSLREGDYVTGSINQKGRTRIVIYLPDGSLLRRFPSPPDDGKRDFEFAAEAAGPYRIEIVPYDETAHYDFRFEVTSLDDHLRSPSQNDRYPSSRMEALRRQVASGNTNTNAFWTQIAAEGTPLAEPFGTDGKYELVTFLWRATYNTKNVMVVGSMRVPSDGFDQPPSSWPSSHYAMRHVEGTDVWYLTLKLPAGARFVYKLSPNDAFATSGQPSATEQADPLNHLPRWECEAGASKFACDSVAEMPGAIAQPWWRKRPGVPEGTIASYTIHSNLQRLDRKISVYTPAGYHADGRPNALLVLFDADTYLNPSTDLPTTMNNLIANAEIPPTVVLFVFNAAGRRLPDLLANSQFSDSVAMELIPWLRAHYNVTKLPSQTVVGGYSAGGFAADYTALLHPEIFGNVLSQSGAVWWSPGIDIDNRDATTETDWLARQYIRRPKLPLKFYLDAGAFEADTHGTGGGVLEANRDFRDVLLAKGYPVRYQQFIGGHDGVSWRGTIADGLIDLLGRAH